MLRFVLLVCGLLPACLLPVCLLLASAVADPAECDRILTSKVPYQLIFLDQADKVTPYQIYRGDNLYKQQLYRIGPRLVIAGFQAGFPLDMMGSAGKTTFIEWNVPTSKYFFDAGIGKARAVTRVEGKVASDVEQTLALLGEEPITVGRCTFVTKHYAIDFDRKSGLVRSEFWLSPGLQSSLKWKHDVVAADGTKRVLASQVLSIQTDFTPFQ